MRVDIKIPSAGESVTEMRIGRWIKSEGESVASDQSILELETDKANMEVPAEVSGALHIVKQDGESVRAGDIVGYIETEAAAERAEDKALALPFAAAADQALTDNPAMAPNADNQSPAIRRLAREYRVDTHSISGSGKKGRLRKEDFLDYLRDHATPTSLTPPSATSPTLASSAREETEPAPIRKNPRERTAPMTLLRRKIAERLVRAQQTAAILTTFNEVDVTAVQKLRSKYKEAFKEKHGIGLGLMSFFVKATVEALHSAPLLNAMIDGDNIVYRDYYNIGVAVSTDRGLVVPVLREADILSFADIERKLADYAAKTRAGKISIEDLSGGTFTISNGGVFGSLLSTPILNSPESGILGMHTIQKRAVVIDDQIQIRPMMYLALSYDHRIIDGKEAVTFLIRIKECLEDPQRLLLAI